MTALRVLMSRFLDLFLKRRREQELAEEIEAHLDLLTQEHVRRGMSLEDARAAARRTFGGVEQVKESYREQRGLPFVETLAQDLRFGVRLLWRDRGFVLTAVLVLGLGIGVNNMLFTVLNAHTIRGLPIDRADRVVYLSTRDDRGNDRGVSYPDFEDIRAAAQSLSAVAVFANAPVTVGDEGRAPERLQGTYVSANAFGLIGGQPILGRTFAPEDDRPGAPAVVILGSGAWQARYGGDRAILGRAIQMNGAPAILIGVLPERFGFPSTAAVWLPLSHMPGVATQKRDARTLSVLGRVRDVHTVEEARVEIESIVDRLSREHPETNQGVRARVVPINERYLGRLTDPAWLAFITAGFLVVLISCANVANLMLARSVHRTREIAIRASMGASRSRVVRQLLIEGGLLAALGGVLGLGLAMAGVRLFRRAIPENILPYWMDYTLDARVFAALVVVSVATVLLFGLVPALHASKTDVNRVLRDGGRTGSGSRGARRWTAVFLTAEFALTIVLLSHVALGLRLARTSLPSDLVLDTNDVLTASITLPAEKYATPEQRAEFYRRLDERLSSMGNLSAVSVASTLPLRRATERRVEVAGRVRANAEATPKVWTVGVGPGYFETLGLAVQRGRAFTRDDGLPGKRHAIVNERFAEMFLENEDPIGQRIAVYSSTAPAESSPAWFRIVGVAPAIRQRPRPDPDPLIYLPFRAAPPATGFILVRSQTEAEAAASVLRDELLALDANVPLYRVATMAQVIDEAEWNGRVSSALVYVITGVAFGLSMIGLYAVTAHSVAQRTQEIGVRMAIGAQPAKVRRLILARAMMQLAVGMLAGMFCVIAWEKVFAPSADSLPGPADPRLTDPQVMVMVAVVLVVVAVAACLIPARRATRLDPVAALRHE